LTGPKPIRALNELLTDDLADMAVVEVAARGYKKEKAR
jgi:hypothetical protein